MSARTQAENLLTLFIFVSCVLIHVQAMTVTLYGERTDTVHKFSIGGVAQRCFNINTCFKGPSKSATWNGVKKNTNVVFYSNENCQTHKAIGRETPDGALYFSDVNFYHNVAAIMIWEMGQYATNGIANACYLDEHATANSSINILA
ncbi:hypothetical protein PHMEG_0004290 [Phytophthora megakarya]|uniref:Uncharacterized protein n=1 Tax=Phytophthora megakarya TaxID=4795 RepID=A0A225WVV0_9STRA|nr:hypothetical protein PHMEG_0004290 [Phytophthora megakarya]